MPDLRVDYKPPGSLQIFDNRFVCGFDMQASKVTYFGGEVARLVYWIWGSSLLVDDTTFHRNIVILLTKCWSLMDNTNTRVIGNVVSVENSEAVILELFIEVVEKRLILPAKHFAALDLLNYLE